MLGGPFKDFEEAGNAVVEFLQRRLGFSLWLVTRTAGENWIVLQAADQGYDVGPGTVFRWSDTFCSRMVEGLGPRIAPASGEVQEYATAPIGEQVPIGAYVGVPLERGDGKLFGTLCAIDPAPQPEAVREELPLVELCGRLLSTVLQHELELADRERAAQVAQVADGVRTHGEANREVALAEFLAPGVLDPASFDQLLDWEDARCRRYGHPASLVAIKLDSAHGDPRTAGRAGAIARERAREGDVVAQTGPVELALLAVEPEDGRIEELTRHIQADLAAAGLKASLSVASRDPSSDLRSAWEAARSA